MVSGRSLAAAVSMACACLGIGWPAGMPDAVAAPSLGEVVDKVQETCAHAQDLSAHFEQIITIRSINQEQRANGILLLKRPRKMRWEYQKPEPRLFVTDGKTLWAYSPADKQVVVQDVDEAFASRLPISILVGDCQLRRDFEITEVGNAATRGSASSRVLDLKPKRPEAGIARMLLEVTLRTYTLERITVFDLSGNTTVYALTDLKLNPGLSDQQFTFVPPAGVTVVTPPKQP